MATLPRASKITSPGSSLFARRQSEFDAGLNTSAAWTEHLEREGSLSDEELDSTNQGIGELPTRPARALYDFLGKPEFKELTVDAGDEIHVLKEDLPDGWSLVKAANNEVGLVPRAYYTFTADFVQEPETARRAASTDSTESTTPRGSPTLSKLVPQTTGEYWRNAFPSFRQSLLGGKSLNRFSSFVTSGAEEWVLRGSEVPVLPPTHSKEDSTVSLSEDDMDNNRLSQIGKGEADHHFVDVGPSWRTKLPPFKVLVHSPSKRSSTLTGAYTIYGVTSLFQDSSDGPTIRVTVYRRFSHFVILHTALTRRLPGIALPPLPDKQYTGRFSDEFVEARRGDLERYIGRVVRHPIARYAEIVTFFLGCESDAEWKRLVPQHLSLPAAGPSFYARVFHPAFNLDLDDANDAVERFETHTKAVEQGIQTLRSVFTGVREAHMEMSKSNRLLSYSLLSLITSKPLASPSTPNISESDGPSDPKTNGLSNGDGAWCWREECEECLKLTKAMQKMTDTLQNIADLYDDHARRTQLATHEVMKGVAHPSSLYESVITTHRSTLSRFKDATRNGSEDEDMASRCETVLNTTMAEMDTYHTQKVEDFSTLTKEHLDGEIAFHEQVSRVLSRLKGARQAFDEPNYSQLATSPRNPSIYERDLGNSRMLVGANYKPLPQPCPHVFDSAPMRPVGVAIQEGMGMLLGTGTSPGQGSRGSIFSNLFW
ncbi:hypothetical protein BDN71DRAFT_1470800 [Pleurotus eryngii]|uniref:PX-domain-containing protein n=1 Tax=Pleurotus eryngii TaxID=5323 RepID=A0A9P6DF80_PLEER|nr:hypothetical protein BDN71DRAFT_1470800 [Pleurotus eryngii]